MKMKLFVLMIVGMTVLAACSGATGAPGVTTPAAPESTMAPSETSVAPAVTAEATTVSGATEVAPAATAEATAVPSGTEASPVTTPESTVPSTGGAAVASPAAPTSWQRVSIPNLSISFEVPSDWHQIGNEWAWSPNASGEPSIGFNWANTGPNFMPTALLPANSQIVHVDTVDLASAKAARYQIQVMDPNDTSKVKSVQTHTIAQAPDGHAYDLFVTGNTDNDVAALQPVIEHMLSSVQLGG